LCISWLCFAVLIICTERNNIKYYHTFTLLYEYYFNRPYHLIRAVSHIIICKAFDTARPKYVGGILLCSQRQCSPLIPLSTRNSVLRYKQILIHMCIMDYACPFGDLLPAHISRVCRLKSKLFFGIAKKAPGNAGNKHIHEDLGILFSPVHIGTLTESFDCCGEPP
jgi:hypothetical protein